MVITVDGLSSTGKSSIAKLLAERLNLNYFSSGYIFRSITYKVLRDNLDIDKVTKEDFNILISNGRVFLDNDDITNYLRDNEISINAAKFANNSNIRDIATDISLNMYKDNVVVDGRDAGTRLFKDANYKIYLTSDMDSRIDRLIKDTNISKEEAYNNIIEKDKYDVNNINIADNVINIDTTFKSIEEIVDEIIGIIN